MKIRVFRDWRIMNTLMRVPAHPLPDPQSSLRDAKDAKWFTSLVVQPAFNNMVIDPDDRKYTAFYTEQGLIQ